MKILWNFFLLAGSLTVLTWYSSIAQSISLDSSFSTDGKVITDFGSYDDRGFSLAIQKDAKLIVAGWTYDGSNYDIAIARYLPNGDLDNAFGLGGKVITPLGDGNSRAWSVIIQPDDKIVIAAEGRLDSVGNTFTLVRYNYDGTLDKTFGIGGKVFTKVGNGNATGLSLAIQQDNKLVVAGGCVHDIYYDFALVRYNSNGSLDNSFGLNGKVITEFNKGNDGANGIAIEDDGKILVVGGSGFSDIALARYKSNGVLDTTFSSDGKVITENYCSCEYSIAIQKDHKIVVVGEINHDIGLFRYNAEGTLDDTFGDHGKTKTDISGSYDRGQAVAIQSDGKIIVTGQTYGSPYADFALLRYNQDGSLDSTFGFDGKLTTDFSNFNDCGYSIGLQKDGKIIVAGEASDELGYNFGIARYKTSEMIHVDSEVKIYPNPTFGKIIIEGIDLNKLVMESKLFLFDELGREIDDFKIDGNSIDIFSLPSGIYFLKLGGEIKKIIKVTF